MRQGHDVEIVRLPISCTDPADVERLIDFSSALDPTRWEAPPDVVVPLRFPAYLVRHPDKRVWLLHQLRQYYEYYEQMKTPGNENAAAALRERLGQVDREALASASRLWVQSVRVGERLQRDNGLSAPVLYPPLPSEEGYREGRQERYIFAPSRLEKHKRQALLVEAMTHVKSDVKAVISGEGGEFHPLKRRIEALGLQDRVLMTGRLSHELMTTWFANSLAVFFCPEDEDYGFVTLEAMLSGKPVITSRDAGEPLQFVKDGENGFVVAPDPREIAARIDALADKPARAKDMGQEGLRRYRALGFSWDNVAETILAPGGKA